MKTANNTSETIQELSQSLYSYLSSRKNPPTPLYQEGTQKSTLSSGQNPPKSPLISGTGRSSIFSPPCGGGTFCEAKGGGAFGRGVRAFTLVELIIVITILAILATIAFISFQGYASKSRDANRLSSVKNAEIGLEVFQTKSGVYPIQSTGAEISVGTGNVITRQGDFDLSIARVINMNEVPRDPKTQAMYNYISDTEGKGYKVLYYLENTPEYALIGQTYASDTQTPVVKGQGPGVVLDSEDEMVSGDIDFFGAQSGTLYTVIVGEGIEIPGTGLELGGGFENFALKGGRLEAPRTCPTGFIPVPGNAEFLQPGFCVAKYEMALERDLVGTGELNVNDNWNTRSGSQTSKGTGTIWEDGKIVSKSGKFPIANITQIQAIGACNHIHTHLITNTEWSTIARNIELNSINWTGKKVGSGYIYIGATKDEIGCSGILSGIYDNIYAPWGARTGEGGTGSGKLDCDNKRVLQLNNQEFIRDFSGNVWEHVNVGNTSYGDFYNSAGYNLCGGNQSGFYSFFGNVYDDYPQCVINNTFLYSLVSPKNTNINASNGVGRVMDNSQTTNKFGKILRRGGGASLGAVKNTSGIYTLNNQKNEDYYDSNTGFRCAY